MAYGPYAALGFRNYRFFALGFLLSALGEQMLDVAVGWEIYQRTNSASALGFAGLAEALPVMLLSLLGGHVSDRYDRKRILLVVQVLLAASSVGLAVVSKLHAPVVWIFVLIATAGVARAFKSPARSALLPQLVPRHLMSNAVTWNSSTFQVASMVGPMIGGFVIAAFGKYSLVYALNAGLALSFLACLVFVRAAPAAPDLTSEKSPNSAQPPVREPLSWHSLWAGVEFIRKTPLLLAVITLDLFAVLLGGATALLPIFARDILHTDATGLGWLRAAPAFGAFLMALALAHLPRRSSPLNHAGPALLWVVAGFGAATIGFGLSTSFPLSMAMLFLTGVFDNVSVVIRLTLLQILTPDKMRGRVAAVNYVFIGASNELGAFESGITAAAFGPVASVVGGGIGTLLVVLIVMRLWPQVARLRSLD